MPYLLLADAIALLHTAIVLFVVGGQALILIGWAVGWIWPRRPGFRWLHLGLIGFVVVQSWLGQLCPLTIWENELRRLAGAAGYAGGFVEYWVHQFLFWSWPHWVFVTVYTLFGGLVLVSFIVYGPRRKDASPEVD